MYSRMRRIHTAQQGGESGNELGDSVRYLTDGWMAKVSRDESSSRRQEERPFLTLMKG